MDLEREAMLHVNSKIKLIASRDTCYVSPVLTTLKTIRYMKHTCTLTKLHILARCHRFRQTSNICDYIYISKVWHNL